MAAKRFSVEEEIAAKQPYFKNQKAVKIDDFRTTPSHAQEEAPNPAQSRTTHGTTHKACWPLRRSFLDINLVDAWPLRLEESDQHLHDTFSNAIREQVRVQCNPVIRPPEPAEAFDLRETLLKEVQEVVLKVRSSSALRTKWNILKVP